MATTYEKIATTTLGSSASTITFSSIPSTYTDLRLAFTGTSAAGRIGFIFNSDSGSNYSTTTIYGGGASVTTQSFQNQANIMLISYSNGPSNTVPAFGTADIFSYAGSTYKTVLVAASSDYNSIYNGVTRNVTLYRSTSAITSITINTNGSDLNSGCTATLYGIKAA